VVVLCVAAAAGFFVFQSGSDDNGQATNGTEPTPGPGEVVNVGKIEIADNDPNAIIDLGTTLLQTDRIVVVLEPGSTRETADAVASALGGEVIGTLEYIDLYQIAVPGGDEPAIRAAIATAATLPGVERAFADELFTFAEEIWGVRTSPMDDPVYSGDNGGGYRAIGVDRAWQYIKGSGLEPWGVKVGVTDTRLWKGSGELDGDGVSGIVPASDETRNPELTSMIPGGWQGQFPSPDGGHATAVTTIIGGDDKNGGAFGVASILGDRMDILHANVLDDTAAGFVAAPADPNDLTRYTNAAGHTWSVRGLEGLLRQVRAGAKVINMSWGCQNCDADTTAAYRRFFTQMAQDHPDVVFVAAAGNDAAEPDGTRSYPGGFPLSNVITVGNVNNDGTTNSSSNLTSADFEVTIAAPGHQAVRGVGPDGSVVNDTTVYGTATRTVNGGQQQLPVTYGGGTSMAAPQVTAAIALMKSLDPTLTATDIKKILRDTARPGVPANPEASAYLPNPIDEKLGAGLLAVDEAVLAVINRVRVAQGMQPITGEQLVSFGVLDAVAISGQPNEYTVRAIVKGCRGDCTDVSISVSGNHALSGSTVQSLAAPGEVEWQVTIAGEYPVTIFVQRKDNGAGSRIFIDKVQIAGTWVGILRLTEFEVSEGQTLPDGTPVEPGTYKGDAIEECLAGFDAALAEGIAEAIRQLREGVPLTLRFTGTFEEPGTVTVIANNGDETTTGWSLQGSSVVFEFMEDETYVAFSGTPTGTTMTGAWGAYEDGGTMRGDFNLTRTGD